MLYLESKESKQSRIGRGSRNKGSTYERTIAKKLGSILDIELVRTPLSGGFAKTKSTSDFKGDITCLEEDAEFFLHVECKNQKSYHLNKWIEQSQEECPKNRIPVLIFKKNNTNNVGKTGNQQDMVTLTLEDFLKLADHSKIVKRNKRKITVVRKTKK